MEQLTVSTSANRANIGNIPPNADYSPQERNRAYTPQRNKPNSFMCDGVKVNVVHAGTADLNEIVEDLFQNY